MSYSIFCSSIIFAFLGVDEKVILKKFNCGRGELREYMGKGRQLG
jgi:hypothetical protein